MSIDWQKALKLKRWLIHLTMLFSLVLVPVGLASSLHSSDQSKQMSGCPIAGMAMICDMSAQEHLTAWQSASATIPIQILFLGLLLSIVGFAFRYLIYRPPAFLNLIHQKSFALTSSHLQEAFSSGIIHSKAH